MFEKKVKYPLSIYDPVEEDSEEKEIIRVVANGAVFVSDRVFYSIGKKGYSNLLITDYPAHSV